jgi:hypothetical protein
MRTEQIPTFRASFRWIMTSRKFGLGVDDVRAGRPFPLDYDLWCNSDDQWNYERGRQWATLTPHDVPVKINGKVNPEALEWFKRYGDAIR